MKKLLCALALLLLFLPPGLTVADSVPSPEQVTEIILSFRETYADKYLWNEEEAGDGLNRSDFLLMVSDAAFGNLPIWKVTPVDYDALRPGDILRLKNDTYSVMIVEKYDDYISVVEVWTDRQGSSRVYWGRTLSKSAVEAADYFLTRYPD